MRFVDASAASLLRIRKSWKSLAKTLTHIHQMKAKRQAGVFRNLQPCRRGWWAMGSPSGFFKDPAGTYILSNNNNNKLDWLTVCIHNLCFEERATTEKKNKNITTPFFQIYVTTQQPPNQDSWVENLDDDDDDDDDGGAFGEVKAPQGIWNTQGSNV